jgi:signal transduction histidine kinase
MTLEDTGSPQSTTSAPRQPARLGEGESLRWMARTETRAILPMKLGLLVLVVVYWLWGRGWQLPSPSAFSLFFLYSALLLTEWVLFAFERFRAAEIRVVAYVSYMVDLLFVTAVIWLDLAEPPITFALVGPGSDFTILYLLLILRGFALFRSTLENTAMAVLLSALFIVTLMWHGAGSADLASTPVIVRLVMIWAVMLLASFIMNVIGAQQEENLRTRERLVRSEGLASLGELAAGVAHEINNPIGIIKTYAEYLKRAANPDDPHQDDYATIQTEAERCEAIVRRMLDFANPEVRSFEDVDLEDLCREVVGFVFHDPSDTRVTGMFAKRGEVPRIRVDRAQIKQALLNVVLNARQILLDNEVPDAKVRVRLRQLPGQRAPVEILVHDNGPGISPEDADRAFEPFFTRRSEGTGLGLAITRRIIEAHAGSIAIWPSAEGGTSVAITLPVNEER